MDKTLLCLNLCNGVAWEHSLYYNSDGLAIIDAIVNVAKKFKFIYVVNDSHHRTDMEFNYAPPHLLENSDYGLEGSLSEYFKQECDKHKINFEVHKKKRWSATYDNAHLRELVLRDTKEVVLCGFDLALDIVPTALLLAQQHPNVKIYRHGTGYVSKENKYLFHYLNYLGIESYDPTSVPETACT